VVTARRRLAPRARRDTLLDSAAALFAARPYDEVLMEEVAERAGVSRALLYRHFTSKRDLFAAIYQRAADRLLVATQLDPAGSLADQVTAGLDAHLDYFEQNRHTVIAANRVLAGDPVVQAIIADELDVLRQRLLDATGPAGRHREVMSAILVNWLAFVRSMCVDWLVNRTCSRDELRDICSGALLGALQPLEGSGEPSRRQ
jgi:AcrR family transcriptional regulator